MTLEEKKEIALGALTSVFSFPWIDENLKAQEEMVKQTLLSIQDEAMLDEFMEKIRQTGESMLAHHVQIEQLTEKRDRVIGEYLDDQESKEEASDLLTNI